MSNDELKKKIVDILHRDFIAREVTPVYIGEDGKEKIMPQKLCDVFNDLTEQALIPYFADALIEAGIGDVKEAECKVKGMVKQNQLLSMALWIVCYEKAGIGMPFKCKHDKCETEMGAHCCRETATDCFIKEAIKQAEKELSEERK